jgi:hypothetical protein
MSIHIEQKANLEIRVTDVDGGNYSVSQTVEANMLFAILAKLEEIRCCVVDVEVNTQGVIDKL